MRLIDRSRRRLERDIHRQRVRSEHSRLTWRVETIGLVEMAASAFDHSTLHRWQLLPGTQGNGTVQIDAHTDEFLPSELGSTTSVAREQPGSLVYSIHPNGSIAVIAYPHASVHAGLKGEKFFLDLVPCASDLAGSSGSARIANHLSTFDQLCLVSAARTAPTARTGRVLRRLRARGERFQNMFDSSGEARRHRLSQELTFGAGLVAGLIASTILPLARDFGNEVRSAAHDSMDFCQRTFSASPSRIEECLRARVYYLDQGLAVWLATPRVLVFALVLSAVVLSMIWRNLRRA